MNTPTALTPRRWGVLRSLLGVLATKPGAPATLIDLAAACPPRLEYQPCYGRHGLGRGVITLECDGDTHWVIRDNDTLAIQPDVDLLRRLGWVRRRSRRTPTSCGGRVGLYVSRA